MENSTYIVRITYFFLIALVKLEAIMLGWRQLSGELLVSMECQCKYKKRFVARLPCAVYLWHEKKKCEVVSMLPHEQS